MEAFLVILTISLALMLTFTSFIIISCFSLEIIIWKHVEKIEDVIDYRIQKCKNVQPFVSCRLGNRFEQEKIFNKFCFETSEHLERLYIIYSIYEMQYNTIEFL